MIDGIARRYLGNWVAFCPHGMALGDKHGCPYRAQYSIVATYYPQGSVDSTVFFDFSC